MLTWIYIIVAFWVGYVWGYVDGEDYAFTPLLQVLATVGTVLYLAWKGLHS